MLQPGQNIAHFKILSILGEGGMGAVYLAEDSKLNRKVALKVLLAETFDDPEYRSRFEREAKTAAQINNPNVMAIYDINTAVEAENNREISYIVMEYVKGVSLGSYIRSGKTDLTGIIRLAEKIGSGLSAAHRLNIVHRDIKPENILIDDQDNPKILDFGLAKPVDPMFQQDTGDITKSIDDDITRAGKIIGTDSYMSPEQAKGESIDTRSDIFSFGILLYRMVTGELPFTGPTQVSTLAKILESKQESPRLHNSAIPPELERIIDKCLQKNQNDRYQDTRDLVVDLRTLRRTYDSGLTESITGETAPVAKIERRYQVDFKGGKSIATSIIIIIALLLFWKFSGDDNSIGTNQVQANENSLAIMGFENKTGLDELDWLETGLPEILLTDLAQSNVMRIISQQRILDCLPAEKRNNHTFEECVDAAGGLGALNILSGSFYKLGDKIRIDARLEEVATGDIVVAIKVVGEDPFILVDSLTNKITASLNLAGSIKEDQAVTTFLSSAEAYQHYQKGLAFFLKELRDEAIEEFNKAIVIDSSFALPYMRIGMAYTFKGQPQVGAKYFGMAKERSGNLPQREKMLVDIYADLWLEPQYDKAFIKMESLVEQYSDDKEAHTIYALLTNAFTHDTVKAFAHYDTALQIDPTYQLALSMLAELHRTLGNFDESININKTIKKYHPDSPESYVNLGRLYAQKLEYENAVSELNEVLERFPYNENALTQLSRLYIFLGNFEKAFQYVEKLKEKDANDPANLFNYHFNMANIFIWQGKLKESMAHRHMGSKAAYDTRDSAVIFTALRSLSSYFWRFGSSDSAMYYLEQSKEYANPLSRVNYPITKINYDPDSYEQLKPYFDEAYAGFRERMPSDMWEFTNIIKEIFEAFAAKDSTMLIDVYQRLIDSPFGAELSNKVMLAKFKVTNNVENESAISSLKENIKGETRTSNGYYYLISQYYLGVAYQNLSDNKSAVKYFQVFLDHWGGSDIPLKEIDDCRRRMASMSS